MRRLLVLLLLVGLGVPLLLTNLVSLAAPLGPTPSAPQPAQAAIELRPATTPGLTSSTDLPQVSAGGFHTCVINRAGQLSCWGNKEDGSTILPANLGPVSRLETEERPSIQRRSTN